MKSQRLTSFCLATLALSLTGACSNGPGVDELVVTALPSPAAAGSAEPNLTRGPDGTLVLSWLEPDAGATALRYSVLRDGAWDAKRTVARGDNWFVNWADFPSVAPINADLWAAHWLVKRPGGTYAYDVAISISGDGGGSWTEHLIPHSDGTPTEHGFVSLFPSSDGVGAMWLDGRNMSGDGHEGGHGGGGMTLRAAVVGADRSLTSEYLVDELVCDCCQTDVAVAGSGPVAVFRNRDEKEIRDIHVARAIDGRWEPGRPVAVDGWEIAGCPVNGPAIAAAGDDVAVAWFTAANGTSSVRMARSSDGAGAFSQAIEIDSGAPIGRVDIELLDNGAAVVSWVRTAAQGHGELLARTVARDGKPGAMHLIAELDTARRSGFPQMARMGEHLIFAWTDTSDPESRVRSARIDIASL